MIRIDGISFDPSITHLSFSGVQIHDMAELSKLREFKCLRSATFADSGLNDAGLRLVSDVPTIEELNLQDTNISDDGLVELRRLPRLTHLRLKGNRQLTDGCIPHLLRLKAVANLQVHETSITHHGLKELVALSSLQDICLDVWAGNFTFDGLIELSGRMPLCRVLAKGRGEFMAGEFRGRWVV